jgi:23S rRNA pseudouridine2457 synthase
MAQVVLLNKPYGVLCQFSADGSGKPTLASHVDVPNVYPAGRLDTDSEGLLALTDSGPLQAHLSSPKHELSKTYWVQCEGVPTPQAIEALARGVILKDGPTKPATVRVIDAPELWPREPPIRFRKNSPTSWLELVLREGRNRQVRRMTAAVGFPTLRLIRVRIGPWSLDGIVPGSYRIISAPELEEHFGTLAHADTSRARRLRESGDRGTTQRKQRKPGAPQPKTALDGRSPDKGRSEGTTTKKAPGARRLAKKPHR